MNIAIQVEVEEDEVVVRLTRDGKTHVRRLERGESRGHWMGTRDSRVEDRELCDVLGISHEQIFMSGAEKLIDSLVELGQREARRL